MISFLNDNPTVIMILNCCMGPAFFIFIGYMIARYRMRIRSPFVIHRDDDEVQF